MRIKPFNYRVCYSFVKNADFCKPHTFLNTNKFKEVRNTTKRWVADPFVISNDGKAYIFGELGSKYYKDRGYSFGIIGYKQIGVKHPTLWHKCIKEKTHMSFPNVFEYNGDFYMIPETSRKRKICLYKATSFPKKWQIVDTLVSDGEYVDHGIFKFQGTIFLLTYRIKTKPYQSLLFIFKNGKFELFSSIEDPKGLYRLAGNPKIVDDKIFVYTQDNTRLLSEGMYGRGLVLSELIISRLEKSHCFKIIDQYDCSEFKQFHTKKISGLHTINFNDNCCVIDVMYDYYSPYAFFRNCLHFCFLIVLKLLVKIKHILFRKNKKHE